MTVYYSQLVLVIRFCGERKSFCIRLPATNDAPTMPIGTLSNEDDDADDADDDGKEQ